MAILTNSTSIRRVGVLGLFAAVALLAYSQILTSYFLSDDFVQIGKVLSGDHSVVWGREHGGFFRPFFILVYTIESGLWKNNPLGYHLANVFFHALNAFLVYLFAVRLLQTSAVSTRIGERVSFAAGLVFLLHPSHTEVASWISGGGDAIATCFCLASLLLFFIYLRSARLLWYILSLLSLSFALLTKESAICLPLLILLCALRQLSLNKTAAPWKRTIKLALPFFLILFAFVLVRALFLHALVGGYGITQHLNFSPAWLGGRLLEAEVRSLLPALPSAWAAFLYKPLKSTLFLLLAVLFLMIILGLVIIRRRSFRAVDRRQQNALILFLYELFLLSFLPVMNLSLSLYETQGERFLYLPSVFSSLFLASILMIMAQKRSLFVGVLLSVLAFYSIALYRTNRTWRDAAHLSLSIKNDLEQSSSGSRLEILNAPDNLRGAPVFHNGLPEALEYFSSKPSPPLVHVISFEKLRNADDRVEVVRNADSLTLNLRNGENRFDRIASSDCVKVVQQSPQSLTLQVNTCIGAELFVFDRGRMTRVGDESR